MLALPFPPADGAVGVPPASADPVPDFIQRSLQDAFDAAPPVLKNRLCDLAGVFITAAPQSWGYRDTNAPHGKYVALSTSLWSGTQPIALEKLETNILLDITQWPQNAGWPAPEYKAAIPNDLRLTIIAQLAHEVGHILLYEIFVDPPGNTANPNFGNFCSGKFFPASWNPVSTFPRWRHRRDVGSEPPLDVPNDPADDPDDDPDPADNLPFADVKVAKLIGAISSSNFPRASRIIARLHAKNRPWPSLRGAFSDVEDFVETFELFVLTNPDGSLQLSSLPLAVTVKNRGGKQKSLKKDIPKSIGSRTLLKAKLHCFDTWFAVHP